MTDFAQQERKNLCDVLTEVGPAAPTLCEGWTTSDLAAHLVVRERRPDAGIGIVVSALSDHTKDVQDKLRDSTGWPQLVEKVRSGPPTLLRPFDEAMNTGEYFIHVEDVRRAQPQWEPRTLPPGLEAALWRRANFFLRGLAKKVPAQIVLDAPGYGRRERGSGPQVTITGPPSEITLFVAGRKDVARLTFAGDEAAVANVKAAKLGL
jgi:uncharacterized protein (TIGR03085 family)